MTDHDNRRGFSRVRLPFPVRVRSGPIMVEGIGINVSAKGILIGVEEDFPENASSTVEIVLDSDNVIQAMAEVIRCKRGQLAVEFTSIDVDSFELLKNLVRYNASDPERVEREFDEHLGLMRR